MTHATLAACDAFIAEKQIDRQAPGWRKKLPKPPLLPTDSARTYYWDLETSHGNLRVKLMPEIAPMHVSSTVYLTRLGFYDGLVFHRVITGFMAQGGCPDGSGMGGPGYKYDGEFSPKAKHDRGGLLSMANAGPGTDGSQFFLTFVPTAWLDGKHSIFGEVQGGGDVLKALEKRGSKSGATSERLTLKKATIAVE